MQKVYRSGVEWMIEEARKKRMQKECTSGVASMREEARMCRRRMKEENSLKAFARDRGVIRGVNRKFVLGAASVDILQ